MTTSQLLAGAGALAAAGAISVLLTPLMKTLARRLDFVDHPTGRGEHKTHATPTPYGGGIAIFWGITLPIVILLITAWSLADTGPGWWPWLDAKVPNWLDWLGGVRLKTPSALAILAGGTVLHVMGLLDDRRPLSPAIKLVLQVLVALVLTGGFGIRAGEFLGSVASVLLTSLWIVALTNAFNFMDNMDGLSAGVAAIASFVLAVCALRAGQVFVPCFMLLVTGAVLGFLIYNFPPASIFMGDGGSLIVGYFLAVAAVLVTYYDPAQQREPAGVLLPLIVFAIPLYDALSVIFRRIRAGKSIFHSDRGHFSHRLVKLGMSRTAAALTIYLATLATALPAVMLPHAAWWQAGLIFGQCLCVVAIIAILETRNGNPAA